MQQARRIGLMGGTFNPVHSGHIGLARQALALADLDQVWFVPSGDPPHKRHDLAPARDRLEMVRLAASGEADGASRFDVNPIEVDRPGRSYTVDTLRALTRRHPGDVFFYIIGSDTLMDLVTWREIESITKLCSFLVFWRPGTPPSWVHAARKHIEEAFGAGVRIMPTTESDISSTDIRRRASLGLSLEGLVPPAVEHYIRCHGLYRPMIPEVPS